MVECMICWDRDMYDDSSSRYELKKWSRAGDFNVGYFSIYVGKYDYEVKGGCIEIDYDKRLIIGRENICLLFIMGGSLGYLVFPNLCELATIEEMVDNNIITDRAMMMSVGEWIVKSIIE